MPCFTSSYLLSYSQGSPKSLATQQVQPIETQPEDRWPGLPSFCHYAPGGNANLTARVSTLSEAHPTESIFNITRKRNAGFLARDQVGGGAAERKCYIKKMN